MKFVRYVYAAAAIYGFAVIAPMFFAEQTVSTQSPPAITHPEYYYGFAAITLVWQILFVLIAFNPERYRPVIGITIVEKLALLPAFLILTPQGRYPPMWIPALIIDLILCALFIVSFFKLRSEHKSVTADGHGKGANPRG